MFLDIYRNTGFLLIFLGRIVTIWSERIIIFRILQTEKVLLKKSIFWDISMASMLSYYKILRRANTKIIWNSEPYSEPRLVFSIYHYLTYFCDTHNLYTWWHLFDNLDKTYIKSENRYFQYNCAPHHLNTDTSPSMVMILQEVWLVKTQLFRFDEDSPKLSYIVSNWK